MDPRVLWPRYMALEGRFDERLAAKTISLLKDKLAAIARRAEKPRLARVLAIDLGRLPSDPALPSLEDFAQRFEPGFYNERELMTLLAASFRLRIGEPGGRGSWLSSWKPWPGSSEYRCRSRRFPIRSRPGSLRFFRLGWKGCQGHFNLPRIPRIEMPLTAAGKGTAGAAVAAVQRAARCPVRATRGDDPEKPVRMA